jgi:hypothetical protein
MTRRKKLIPVAAMIIFCAVVTLPFWGMGPAVFLDTERTVISRVPSPDGRRLAQVERIVIGGTPSIVIMVKPQWMPDWYLAACAAASHYHDVAVQVRWSTKDAIDVTSSDEPLYWDIGSAPFHRAPCDGLTVTFNVKPSQASSPLSTKSRQS